MNDKQAKKLRKKIYGDKDFIDRSYTEVISKKQVFFQGTEKEYAFEQKTIIADKDRRWYKNAKKVYKDLLANRINNEMLELARKRGN